MLFLNIFLLSLVNLSIAKSHEAKIKRPNAIQKLDLADILGLGERYHDRLKMQPSLNNSASKFLLEVFNDITESETDLDHVRRHLMGKSRRKRAIEEENFITNIDRMDIEDCNNIITFCSKSE